MGIPAFRPGGKSYPVLSSLFGDGEFDLELSTLFSFGLERMLDGVQLLIDRSHEVPTKRRR